VVTATEMTASSAAVAVAGPGPAAGGRGWPLAPLLGACGLSASALARRLGVGGAVVSAAARRGLTDRQADEWAIRLGFHPMLVWGWAWIDDADHALGRPAWVRVAGALRHQIARGDLVPGDPLPGIQALAARWGVAARGVTRALDELRAEGLLTSRGPGRPSVVAASLVAGAAGCVACGQPIELGEEHYPHRPACTLAARGWCDCGDQAHPECCPTCAAGGS
jgi:Bacterial regulatory proteins, gntR family